MTLRIIDILSISIYTLLIIIAMLNDVWFLFEKVGVDKEDAIPVILILGPHEMLHFVLCLNIEASRRVLLISQWLIPDIQELCCERHASQQLHPEREVTFLRFPRLFVKVKFLIEIKRLGLELDFLRKPVVCNKNRFIR